MLLEDVSSSYRSHEVRFSHVQEEVVMHVSLFVFDDSDATEVATSINKWMDDNPELKVVKTQMRYFGTAPHGFRICLAIWYNAPA